MSRLDDAEKGALSSRLEDLQGVTIEAIATLSAEVPRQSKQYVLIKGTNTDGEPVRLIFAMCEVKSVCPDHGLMLTDMIEGIDFFALDEVRTRQRGQALLPADARNVDENQT